MDNVSYSSTRFLEPNKAGPLERNEVPAVFLPWKPSLFSDAVYNILPAGLSIMPWDVIGNGMRIWGNPLLSPGIMFYAMDSEGFDPDDFDVDISENTWTRDGDVDDEDDEDDESDGGGDASDGRDDDDDNDGDSGDDDDNGGSGEPELNPWMPPGFPLPPPIPFPPPPVPPCPGGGGGG